MKKSLFTLALATMLVLPMSAQAKKGDLIFEPISVQNNYYDSIEYLSDDFKEPIKAVFSDIENVLAVKSASQYSISDNTAQTVKKLKELNFPLILMTDKSTVHARNIADSLGIKDSYIIANNGAVIIDEYDSTIFINGIYKKDLDKILNDVKSFNNYYKTLSKGFFYANKKLYAFGKIELPYISDTPVIIKKTNDLGENFITTQISFYEPNAKTLRALKRYLQKRYGENFSITTAENCYINITSKSVSKTNALIVLAEKFGYSLNNISVFGNDIDDIEYLRLIKSNGGLALTFKSSPEKVKEASNFVIDSSDYKAFSVGINSILENNKNLKK